MKTRHAVLALAASAVFCGRIAALDVPNKAGDANYVPGQVVVKLRAHVGRVPSIAQAAAVGQRQGQAQVAAVLAGPIRNRSNHGGLDSVFVFDYSEQADVRNLIYLLLKDPEVAYAEPNYICRIATAPNDPY